MSMASSAQFFSVVSNLSTTIAGSLPFRSALSSSSEPSRDLDRYHHAKVRPLLDAVDKLRGILAGTDTDIQLPSIVVVGDQSSGKSSVLESLADVNLPRGQNITTRVPLILRLVNLTPDDDKSSATPAAYATISAAGVSEEKISLKDVAFKVDAFTKSLAGTSVGVTDKPITLTVYRPHSPEITLIDLPGIVRNPIGDQPKDIYQQIRKMIKTYIAPETSIILNVMPSTVDFPTCECITLSREVDPQLARSIAVVTKLDLSEKGISKKLRDAVDQLGLHLGVVCVKNRNHEENERGVTFEEARGNEMKFFEQHKELSVFLEIQQMNLNGSNGIHEAKPLDGKHPAVIPRGRILIGTPQLALLLASIQEKHVRNVLPRVETKIRQLLNDTRIEYKSLPPACTSPSEARFRFDQMLLGFVTRASALCKGDHSTAPTNEKLHISARLYGLYTDFLHELARVSSVFLSRDYADVIQREMRENAGVTLSTFQSPQVFHGLWLNELAKFRPIISKLIDTVRSLHSSLLLTLCKDTFGAFPPLHQVVSVQCSRFIDSCYRTVADRVEELLAQEEDVFTMNGYYEDTSKKLNEMLQAKLREGKNSNTSVQVNDLTLYLNLSEFTGSNVQVSSMQVYMLVYNTLAQKRIADNLIKAFRFHFTRAIYSTPQLNKNSWIANGPSGTQQATPTTPTAAAAAAAASSSSSSSSFSSVSSLSTLGLLSVLQKECQQYSDTQMLEFFKEMPELSERRERIKTKLSKLEKSMQVMEAVR